MNSNPPERFEHLERVIRTMEEFAAATGLFPRRDSPRRYLWTDAFALCNLIGLFSATADDIWLTRASELIDQVHNHLGRFRDDDHNVERRGTPLSSSAGHPTRAGLRIGKVLAELRPDEAFDERQEWDRDGQYYHYLTKWMHALAQASHMSADSRYACWAQELAQGVHRKFVHSDHAGVKRIYWKMSIDLARPIVHSMGHHDPLDGFITLKHLAAALPPPLGLDLSQQQGELGSMLIGRDWATTDPLGLGGLMCDAYRVAQLLERTGDQRLRQLFAVVVDAAARGLIGYATSFNNAMPAHYRLAFREFGLSIGLEAVRRMRDNTGFGPVVQQALGAIMQHQRISDEINAFWSDPENRNATTWLEHPDINAVMWATALMPDGFLELNLM